MKDIRIYNYAMSEAEISALFESYDLRPPLVAHWPMDDGSGTVVADEVGDNDGEIVGNDPPEWIAGGGLAFNDIDSNHVEVPHADILDFADESFSVSMLVRYDQDAALSTDRWIIKGTHGGDGTGSRYEIFRTSGTTVRFSIDNGPDNIKSALEVPSMEYLTGDWVHVVAVRDAIQDTMMLFANAVFQGGRHDNSGDISSGEDMWIGESTDETGTAMSGDMKDVRIYSYALSNAEITELFESYGIQSADAYLTAITFDPAAALNPEFDKATFAYTGNLPAGTASAAVTATKSDENATVAGEGSVDVSSGSGTAELVVTAANGITVRTYTVNLLTTATRDLVVSGLNVYPNPAANNLVIEGEVELSTAYIYNSSGQLVKSVKDIKSNTVDIDVSGLNSGLYLVNIISVDADAVNFTFIKK
jgi:hypothetical protein